MEGMKGMRPDRNCDAEAVGSQREAEINWNSTIISVFDILIYVIVE